MLIGTYHHTLQAKGRLAIPVKYRPQLGDTPVITRGFEPHLTLLPFNTWSNLIRDLGDSPLVAKPQRDLRRFLSHNAAELDFDAQGRILIPQPLLEAARLSRDVVVAGSLHWVEIWDREAYFKYQAKIETEAPSLIDSYLAANTHD